MQNFFDFTNITENTKECIRYFLVWYVFAILIKNFTGFVLKKIGVIVWFWLKDIIWPAIYGYLQEIDENVEEEEDNNSNDNNNSSFKQEMKKILNVIALEIEKQ